MSETAKLQRLLTFLSPAFPVGAFAWSAGLETAIAERTLADSTHLQNWLSGSLVHGSLRTDAILLSVAHRTPPEDLAHVADLAIALTPSLERTQEMLLTGDAFTKAAAAWPSDVYVRLPSSCPYPIAVGAIAAAHGIALESALLGYLTAAIQSQVSVAVRLVPIGQSAGLAVIAALESEVARLAVYATTATLDDLGGIAYATDIAQMRHETLPTRIFRS
jgi:urease accessory protein